jgi:hypothetical protein
MMDRLAEVMVVVMVLVVAPQLFAQPATAQEPGGAPERLLFQVDDFTYRASFQLTDGTEAFLIRSSYKLTYLYQHHQPTISNHYISVTVGFYYGKTVLGRSLIRNISYSEIAFYPKWIDSAGYSHDWFPKTPVFSVVGPVSDGRLVSGYLLLDTDAKSQYLPMFGGTLVLSGLRITLIDGSVINYSSKQLDIELEKYSNDIRPKNATLSGADVVYSSSNGYIYIDTMGSAQPVVFSDLVVAIAILGAIGAVVVLGILHLKGKITLPISRFRSVMKKEPSQTAMP